MKRKLQNQGPEIVLIIFLLIFQSIDLMSQTAFALNLSEQTDCAEEDNVNIPIIAEGVQTVRITAVHPSYPFDQENCDPNFDNCNIGPGGNPDQCETIYDDGINVIRSCIVDNWWRDTTMSIELTNGISREAHYVVLIKKIVDANSWPEFFVLYQDGNLRLIPHPPVGVQSVCYGSSVIVGPAEEDETRPFVEIEKIEIIPSSLELTVSYINGGGATMSTSVNRDSASVDVAINYPTDVPTVTFRSMWVEDGNCDVDNISSGTDTIPVLGSWDTILNSTFLFHRRLPSIHNNSSPDIRIGFDGISNSMDKDYLQNDAFSVFPNPTLNNIGVKSNGTFTIDRVEIYSSEGSCIKKIHSDFESIELSDFSTGIYFVRIISESRFAMKKIMKI